MVRSELIAVLAEENPDLTLRDVEIIVTTFFDTIVWRLAADGRVELRGFGVFSTRSRDARTGRNPRSGALVVLRSKRVPYFKTSKGLQACLNVPARSAPRSKKPGLNERA
ncbi:MAG: HU family DNA-binding protein [Sphingomonas sp.]